MGVPAPGVVSLEGTSAPLCHSLAAGPLRHLEEPEGGYGVVNVGLYASEPTTMSEPFSFLIFLGVTILGVVAVVRILDNASGARSSLHHDERR